MEELFKEELLKQLRLLVSPDYSVSVQEVLKVNDILKHAVSIRNPDQRISCNFYIEDLYAEHERTGIPIQAIAQRIVNQSYEKPFATDDELSDFLDILPSYDKIKGKIMCKLINLRKNSEYLQDKFYLPYLKDDDGFELAVCFIIMVSDKPDFTGSFAIPKTIRASWNNISDEDILNDAITNMSNRYGYYVRDIIDVLCKLAACSNREDVCCLMSEAYKFAEPSLYVLSNEANFYGATALLYPDILKDFAESKNTDLYIIPSSVSEVIIIPVDDRIKPKEISSMIIDVNRTEVPASEILSDKLFYYSRECDQLQLYTPEDRID